MHSYPPEIWKQPGEKAPNRAALAAWGSWVNAFARAEYGRPLFIVCSADLADSTNIVGFAKDFGEMPGWGWYQRDTNPRGSLLPQQITEFTNAGLMAGLATVNLADDPMRAFNGFWGACSTYGSFSYLKYGPMRLFSQLAQDSQLKLGKVIWVAGHSGPETAEDSRTHFGIFETGVTQLFPEGQVIDLHPWEYNEVPVVLAAALATDVPIVALHLTRPAVDIPDRAALGMASHFEAARGAYLLRDVVAGTPSAGTVYVQGTVTTANVVKILPELDKRGINVRIVAAISPQLFRRQDAGLPGADLLGRGPMGRHGHHQPRLQADDRFRGRTDRPGLFPLIGLGQPLADRRDGRRGDGRGAPGPRPHPRCNRALRPRSRGAPRAAARDRGRRRAGRLSDRMPESHPHSYEHQPPRRPRGLARRMTPPPEHPVPPNLRLLLYAGLALAAVVVALAVPYVIGYLVQLVTH